MVTKQESCLSDFWREDKSDDRVMELSSVLMGADSLIGVMGSGVRAVWSTNGQSETWWVRMKQGKRAEMRVFLDYHPLASLQPPFSGRAVDEVIGYSAHEGGHCLWSHGDSRDVAMDIMGKRTERKTRDALTDPNNIYLAADGQTKMNKAVDEVLRIGNILEDAFIDFHVGEHWPVLGEYIRYARQMVAERRPIDYSVIALDPRPARNAIINLWIGCSLYDKPLPDKMSARVRRAMNFLMSKSIEAVKEENANHRMVLTVDCWEYLQKEFPVADAPLPRQEPQHPQSQGREDGEEGGAGQASSGGNSGSEGKGKSQGEHGETSDHENQSNKRSDKADAGEKENPPDEDECGKDGGESEPSQPEDAKEEESDCVKQSVPDRKDEKQEDEAQGGSEQGSRGNLDEFDIRDLGEVPQELLEKVLDAIAHEEEDISRSVAEVINRPVKDIMAQTKKADYDGPMADQVRAAVEKEVQEMRRVFDRQADVKSRHIKGLTSGKLDRRSLAKVGAGNLRVYKRREVLDTPDLAVGLLLDVSGSMASRMDTVWATGSVFAEALIRKQGVNFLCLTYTGGAFEVRTTRICDREMGKLCLGNVVQGGGTPSGPAIASMKVLMDRMRERRKVIIHFTDGAPDESWSVQQAVEAARKAGYAVWAVVPQGYERMAESQYGADNWESIGSIRDLPGKIAELVQRLVAR